MKAIIIGAGIGGFAAAIGLERAGVEVAIYERVAHLHEVGAGLTLWANATRALGQLGVGDLLGPLSMPDMQADIRTADGALLVSGMNDNAQSGPPLAVALHRADLHSALLSRIDPTRLHLGAALVGFEQDQAGVSARFADGATARADLLIGADGIGAQVRAQLHGEPPPRYAATSGSASHARRRSSASRGALARWASGVARLPCGCGPG